MRLKNFIALALIFTFAISAAIFAAYESNANNTIPAYAYPELKYRNGNERVDAGYRLIVFKERENSYFTANGKVSGTRLEPNNYFNQ